MYAVIMAGGQGTRLWPKSRQSQPKQLHRLIGDKSLIQQCYANLSPAIKVEDFFVSTTPQYLKEIQNQLPDISEDHFIVEPYPMDTAAACGLVSKILYLRDPESTAAFFPSDHYIRNPKRFAETVRYAESIAKKYPGHILTLGIKPHKADTGMGYIKFGAEVSQTGVMKVNAVEKFVEKPDQKTAKEYLASGEYLWNAGIFVWKTSLILDLIKKDLPQTSKALNKIAAEYGKAGYAKAIEKYYKETDDTSIDYGIMEKNKNILVVPGDFGWSDVGSWGTVLEVLSEINGSNIVSRGHHMSIDDSNVLVMADDKLVATIGLKDVVIIDTPDALLICKSDQAHKVKDLIKKIKDQGEHNYL